MTAYYNEIDPYAAQWLRNLIAAGHIAPGDVDERSIEDVRPDDLRGYKQCHFFAGIGVWSCALRLAGWPDDRPIWTGSCPCQPFSAAGKGGGFADERHLWPAWEWLISQCRPTTVLGEQVASKDGLVWLDLVSSDLEGQGYTFGALDTCSAGHGAPHIRQRIRFAAHDLRSSTGGLQYTAGIGRLERGAEPSGRGAPSGRGSDRLAHGDNAGLEGRGQPGCERAAERLAGSSDVVGGMAERERIGRATVQRAGRGDVGSGRDSERARAGLRSGGSDGRPLPTSGFWGTADWLLCRDGKWRPVEPGTFPLAHGASARVGRLRAYGNAVDAQATAAFIEAVMESIDRRPS